MGVNDLSEPLAAGGAAQPPPMPPVEVAVLVSSDKDPKVQQEGAGTAASREPEEAEDAKVFNEMDTKNDGGIDRAEWHAQGHDDASFDRIDTNHDGKIDSAEWAAKQGEKKGWEEGEKQGEEEGERKGESKAREADVVKVCVV